MASNGGSVWPTIGVRDVDRRIHSRNLLQEARLLKAFSANTTGKKRAVPSATAVSFLESLIAYLDAPAAKNDQDQLWQAFQQLQTDIKAQHAQQNASIQKLLSKGAQQPKQQQEQSPAGTSTWSSVAGTPAAARSANITTVSSSTARASQLNSLTAKEIRITVNNNKTKSALKALDKPNETILLKANEAITKALGAHHCTSHNHNTGAQSTANTPATATSPTRANWIDSVRLMNSGDVFLYAHSTNMVDKIIHSSGEWEDFLGEGATEVVVPTYGVVVSSIPIRSINMAEQEEIAGKLYSSNPALIHSVSEIKRIIWLTKHKPGKQTNAIVVYFYSKEIANACIKARKITWEGAPKSTQQYSKKAQVCQCFNCYGFNHTARMCKAKTHCGFCASETHTTKEHRTQDKSKFKCVNCKGNHTAFSRDCKAHKREVERVMAERKRLQFDPLFLVETALTPSVSERGSRPPTPRGESPETPTQKQAQAALNTPESEAQDKQMEGGVSEEPEVQSAQGLNMEEDSSSEEESGNELNALLPAASQPIFKITAVPPPQPRTPFKAPQNMENLFGPAQKPAIDPRTPRNRKFKAAARKLQSSPIKGPDDGNVSDGYTVVEGKGGKRAAKKGHTASLGKVKQTRLTNNGRFDALADEEMEYSIQESETLTAANPIGTGSGPESNGESSSEVSSSSSGSSSAESSAAGAATQTRSSTRRH
jgi:hypothetical protein